MAASPILFLVPMETARLLPPAVVEQSTQFLMEAASAMYKRGCIPADNCHKIAMVTTAFSRRNRKGKCDITADISFLMSIRYRLNFVSSAAYTIFADDMVLFKNAIAQRIIMPELASKIIRIHHENYDALKSLVMPIRLVPRYTTWDLLNYRP